MRSIFFINFYKVIIILALAIYLLFELVPPVSQKGLSEPKLVPITKLWGASFEGASPQNMPMVHRFELAAQKSSDLGLDKQYIIRTIILLCVIVSSIYFLQPPNKRIFNQIAAKIDRKLSNYRIYVNIVDISRKSMFSIVVILLTIILIWQNDLLDNALLDKNHKLNRTVYQPFPKISPEN